MIRKDIFQPRAAYERYVNNIAESLYSKYSFNKQQLELLEQRHKILQANIRKIESNK